MEVSLRCLTVFQCDAQLIAPASITTVHDLPDGGEQPEDGSKLYYILIMHRLIALSGFYVLYTSPEGVLTSSKITLTPDSASLASHLLRGLKAALPSA